MPLLYRHGLLLAGILVRAMAQRCIASAEAAISRAPERKPRDYTSSRLFKRHLAQFFCPLCSTHRWTVAEVGMHHGYTTAVLAAVFHKVIAVDYLEFNADIAAQYLNSSDNVFLVVADSRYDRWQAFRGNQIDAVVVDAGHDYGSVCADIENALRLKTVKYLAFHDFPAKQVRAAVRKYQKLGALSNCQPVGMGWDNSTWNYVGEDTNFAEGVICRRGKLGALRPHFIQRAFYLYNSAKPSDDIPNELRHETICHFLPLGKLKCSKREQGSWSVMSNRVLRVRLSKAESEMTLTFNKDQTAFLMGPYFGLDETIIYLEFMQAKRLFKDLKNFQR